SGGGTDQTIGTVNVDITAVNDEQVLATNTGDTVTEGSTGNTVTTAMLETTDVDNTDSQLVYTVDAVPINGTLYRNGTALNVSDTFTQADIDAGLISYDHDGS
ncbi:cadherin-like domain-containing protein, partial [Rhodopirellula sp. JC639]|uniref:cadherin-like domain-containing protein n=1 Tax=Stieleria mannarensis TaxID=2755585 RepID=UPI001601CDBD